MPKHIHADAEMNFPTPTTAMATMQVDAMHRAGVIVTAPTLAGALQAQRAGHQTHPASRREHSAAEE